MKQRLNALERLDRGESVASVTNNHNVGTSTVHDRRKNRKVVEYFCVKVGGDEALKTGL